MVAKAKAVKTSRYKRYKDGLWLKSRYLLYRYWYKFLQYAENDPQRTVDWSKYDGWGGAEVVTNQRFEDWWKDHWKELFAVKNETDSARYEIAHRKARAETIRIALLVYEHQDAGQYQDIYLKLQKRYKNLGSLDATLETKYANQHVKRYMQQAEGLLDQVCRGEFG